TCRFLSSLKTLAIPAGDHAVDHPSTSRLSPYGRFSAVHVWPVLGVHRGFRDTRSSPAVVMMWRTRLRAFTGTRAPHFGQGFGLASSGGRASIAAASESSPKPR